MTFRDHYTDLEITGRSALLEDTRRGIDAMIALWFAAHPEATDAPEDILALVNVLGSHIHGYITSDRFDHAWWNQECLKAATP